MTVKLENLTDRPVLLTLSTGDILRLSPGETSESLEDVTVQASGKIDKLVANGVITVHEPKRPTGKTTRRATARKTTGKATARKEDDRSAKEEKAPTK